MPRIRGGGPATKLRMVGLGLTALLGSLLVIGISRTTWRRVDHLQLEFASLKADSFYMGVRMRSEIQRLNETLLRYRLRGDSADADAFRIGAQDFKQWLEVNSTNSATALERTFFEQIGAAYDSYLLESLTVLEASRARFEATRAKDFRDSYEKVQAQSQYLLTLCDTFIGNQRSSFEAFLKESNRTLTSFRQLLQLSLGLLLALAAALVVLVYRGMIAPLRHRLTESHAIIARQEKLASLGVLAAGVAHEIRNPLTAIKFRLFSLKKSLPATAAGNEDALVIGDEINRLERIVKDFLQFARPSEPDLVTIPVQRILQEVHDLLKPQLEKSAIRLKLGTSEPAWVRADSQQIKQVLINLIQNSADSIGRDGEITLRAKNESDPNSKGSPATVAMEVEDNGKGIPPEVQKRLFDPFFTTKEGGSGLGLPIAARIVEKHGGQLYYSTELDRGTTFGIVLPRVGEHETQSPPDRRR
ncbi:MAG TPA: ATP-binding protein [Candidatus Nitrosotalea sp.]|nr:ATP-binding protein [Candidatus Nitrosotalea sp.]